MEEEWEGKVGGEEEEEWVVEEEGKRVGGRRGVIGGRRSERVRGVGVRTEWRRIGKRR